jgi:predicted DNA-binding transcriptional regulator AlpA
MHAMQTAHITNCAVDRAADPVRNLRYTASVLRISVATLRRLIADGVGPKVVRVSERRHGIRDSERERWLSERTTGCCSKHEEAQ